MCKDKIFSKWMLAIAFLLPAVALPIGDAGSDLSFDGTTKVVIVPDNPLLDSLKQQYTLEVWVNLTANTTSHRILRRPDVFSLHVNALNQIEFKSETLPSAPTINSNAITLGVWHHVAARRIAQGAGYLTSIFIDGVQSGVTSTSADFALPATGDPLLIGNRNTLDRCWNGSIDEVRLWKVSRTDDEIKTFRGQPLIGTEAGLLAYYKLDEGAGQAVNDATVNNLDGALGTDPLNPDVNDPVWAVSDAPVGYNLLAPNGGAANIGIPLLVTWVANPEAANVHLQFSVDGGASWMYIAFNTPNDGSFSTFVPGFPTTNAVFRVTDPSDAANFDDSDALITFNSVGSWQKTVTKEAEDAVITKPMHTNWDGHAFDCTFIYTSHDQEGTADITVNIPTDGLYSLWGRARAKGGTRNSFFVAVDGGMEYMWDTEKRDQWIWDTISHRGATGIPNVTAEINPILLNLAAGNHTIRIRGREHYTRLDRIRLTNDLTATYLDEPNEWVELVNPQDGEDGGVVTRNTVYEITWKSQNISDEVTIEFSQNDRFFTNPILIVRGTDNDGSYLWTVPDDTVDDAFIRISDGDGGSCPLDQTWDAFSIVNPPPKVTLTVPNGGEEWKANSTHTVSWTASYFTDPVDLALSIDNGKTWTAIATNKPATGTLSWVVPNTPSDSCLIRVFDKADGVPADTSDQAFEILPADQPGQDYALSFDGVNDFVEVAHHASLNVDQKFTIEFWIKTGTPKQSWTRVLEKGSWDEYYLGFYGTTGKMHGGLRTVIPGSGSSMTIPLGPSQTILAANKWYHIAATYDGAKATLYVNGVSESVKSAVAQPRDLMGALIIGAVKRVSQYQNHFKGVLDELRIWNIDRTATEIANSMFASLAGNEAGLVAYYTFDEGSGQVAGDLTANNNDGRLGISVGADGSDPAWVVSDRPTSLLLMASEPSILSKEVIEEVATVPDKFDLAQNYPNPFNASTTLTYDVPLVEDGGVNVTLTIYDVQGRIIRTLVHGAVEAGSHQIVWDGAAEDGSLVASGVYFYQMKAGDFADTKRMVLLK